MSKIKQIKIPVTVKVRCTHPHYCYEWDSLYITPICPEWDACVCECDGKPWSIKDWKKLDKEMCDDGFGNRDRLKAYLKHIGVEV